METIAMVLDSGKARYCRKDFTCTSSAPAHERITVDKRTRLRKEAKGRSERSGARGSGAELEFEAAGVIDGRI
jgi:hypothetical protein